MGIFLNTLKNKLNRGGCVIKALAMSLPVSVKNRLNRKGSAIAAVVVFMFIFTILGITAVRIFTAQNLLNAEDITHARVFYAADAGIELARNGIVNEPGFVFPSGAAVFTVINNPDFDTNHPPIMHTVTLREDVAPNAAGGYYEGTAAVPVYHADFYAGRVSWTPKYYILTSTAETKFDTISKVKTTIEYRFLVRELIATEPVFYTDGTKRKFIFRSWREV